MTQNITQPYTKEASSLVDIEKNAENSNEKNDGTAVEKTFTQSEVEKLINERIKRERKVNQSLLPVRQLLRKMADEGVVEGESYSEIARLLVSKLQKIDGGVSKEADGGQGACGIDSPSEMQENEQEEGKEDACEQENLSQARDDAQKGGEGTEVSESDVKEKKTSTQQVSMTFSDIMSLKEKYPDADMNLLFDGGRFERFARGKSSSLEEIYDDYCAFLSEFSPTSAATYGRENEEAYARAYGDVQLASTAFSSHSGTSPVSDGLTKQQMEIAKSAGLSYREYAELLSSIPKSVPRITN